MNAGFIRFVRSPIATEIMRDQIAWSLLGFIAVRARFQDGPNQHNLSVGEALIGDYDAMGLTHKEYRCGLDRLERKWKQVTTQRTNHGTIAKLTESAIFDFSTTNSGPTQCITHEKGKQKGNRFP